MQIVALTAFHFGLRQDEEIIHRGTTFAAPGTGIMSAREHAQSLIRSGMCCAPEDWAKREAKTQAGHDWATAEVARLDAQKPARQAQQAAPLP